MIFLVKFEGNCLWVKKDKIKNDSISSHSFEKPGWFKKRIFEILAIWQELIRDNKITLKDGVPWTQVFW